MVIFYVFQKKKIENQLTVGVHNGSTEFSLKNKSLRLISSYIFSKTYREFYIANSRYNRRNGPQIYVCYIVKYIISSEFYMVKHVINFELFSVIKNSSVIAMSVITRVDCNRF